MGRTRVIDLPSDKRLRLPTGDTTLEAACANTADTTAQGRLLARLLSSLLLAEYAVVKQHLLHQLLCASQPELAPTPHGSSHASEVELETQCDLRASEMNTLSLISSLYTLLHSCFGYQLVPAIEYTAVCDKRVSWNALSMLDPLLLHNLRDYIPDLLCAHSFNERALMLRSSRVYCQTLAPARYIGTKIRLLLGFDPLLHQKAVFRSSGATVATAALVCTRYAHRISLLWRLFAVEHFLCEPVYSDVLVIYRGHPQHDAACKLRIVRYSDVPARLMHLCLPDPPSYSYQYKLVAAGCVSLCFLVFLTIALPVLFQPNLHLSHAISLTSASSVLEQAMSHCLCLLLFVALVFWSTGELKAQQDHVSATLKRECNASRQEHALRNFVDEMVEHESGEAIAAYCTIQACGNGASLAHSKLKSCCEDWLGQLGAPRCDFDAASAFQKLKRCGIAREANSSVSVLPWTQAVQCLVARWNTLFALGENEQVDLNDFEHHRTISGLLSIRSSTMSPSSSDGHINSNCMVENETQASEIERLKKQQRALLSKVKKLQESIECDPTQ